MNPRCVSANIAACGLLHRQQWFGFIFSCLLKYVKAFLRHSRFISILVAAFPFAASIPGNGGKLHAIAGCVSTHTPHSHQSTITVSNIHYTFNILVCIASRAEPAL
jgi:hypothetical protein